MLVIIKLFLIYYFLTFLFIFKFTTIDCESKIINKQLKLFIYMFFNKHSIKYASRNSYSSDEKQDWVS